MKDFITTYAIRTESFRTDIFEKSSLHIRLYSIVHLDIVLLCKHCHMIDSLAKKIHIIVIERSRYLVKLFYNAVIKHFSPF